MIKQIIKHMLSWLPVRRLEEWLKSEKEIFQDYFAVEGEYEVIITALLSPLIPSYPLSLKILMKLNKKNSSW